VASVFLSADIKAGNMQGMNPYGYVGGNPETKNDPTGQRYADMKGDYAYVTSDGNHGVNIYTFVSIYNSGNVWETYYHMNTRHLIDQTNGFLRDYHTDSKNTLFSQFVGWVGAAWNQVVAAYHDAANDPYAQLALGLSGGLEDGNGLKEENLTLTPEELGALREEYVKDNLSSLIPDAGGNLRPQVDFTVPGSARARADFVTDNAIVEVGGISKAGDLSHFGQQLSVYTKSAQPGQKVYFLYDNSTGALPSSLQRIADEKGVTIIQFTLPPFQIMYN
jgi:hypothetical protein